MNGTRTTEGSKEFHSRVLQVALADVGKVAEIKGPEDHPKIELAHAITKIESGLVQKPNSDEIPWCSSIMNLWHLIAGARMNPGQVFRWLAERNQTHLFFRIMAYAHPTWRNISEAEKEAYKTMNSGLWIPKPTFSAWARSWEDWGFPVPTKDAQVGDMAVFIRDGGGHIAIFMKMGWTTVTVVGGNQNNEVCSADWYARTRLIGIRRA